MSTGSNNRQRQHQVHVRLTEWEYAAILEQATARAIKPPAVLREAFMAEQWRRENFHRLLIKPVRDQDAYVCWSEIMEEPTWTGTRAEALAEGCPVEYLDRADSHGSNSYVSQMHWSWERVIFQQRGFVPRDKITALTVAFCEGRQEDCWDLLEPLADGMEVRRG